MRHPLRRPIPTTRTVLTVAMLLGTTFGLGCDSSSVPEVGLDDLGPGELLYVHRVVSLERAKAVALVDRTAGTALLDSLAAAWGNNSLDETVAGVPGDPVRAGAVGRLLARILVAEQDSLVMAPRPDRLAAPLPDPPPETKK